MTNLFKKITKLVMIPILAGSLIYEPKIIKKIENSEYIKNIRKENKENLEFQNRFLNAKKDNKVVYAHCGQNLPLWYVDIDGDKKFDGYILHVPSFRGTHQIRLYKIKQERK